MFYTEFSYAVHEGDGNRIIRCWRFLRPLFKASRQKNYCLETFLLYGHKYRLSLKFSHQLVWSRCINTHGLPGHSIPCDLIMEHLNRLCKEAIVGLGANKTEDAIVSVGKAIGTLLPVLEQFDEINFVPNVSGIHCRSPSVKDTRQLDPFTPKGTRLRKHFKNIKPLPPEHKPDKLLTWMKGHMKTLTSKTILIYYICAFRLSFVYFDQSL